MTQHVITIDPGSESTGVAVWAEDQESPSRTFLLRPTERHQDFVNRTIDISLQLNQIVGLLPGGSRSLKRIVCEFPEVFMSAGSVAAAQSGSLLKLAFVCGAFANTAAHNSVVFQPVRVRDWKGQLSKEQVIRRIQRLLGDAPCAAFKDDIWDAVGIGLWYRGKL